MQGARAFYETIIKRGEDVLAEVKSSWCCLDAETLRQRAGGNVPNHHLERHDLDLAHKLLTDIPGVTCVKPQAALYMFPRLDPKMYPIADDQQFAYELLAEEKVLIVQGTGFNWSHPDHFRLVFLPNSDDLTDAIGRIARFLEGYRKRHGTA